MGVNLMPASTGGQSTVDPSVAGGEVGEEGVAPAAAQLENSEKEQRDVSGSTAVQGDIMPGEYHQR